MCTPRPVSPLSTAGSVATSVLPSPVAISAIVPSWSTMPPMSWTSKCRMPSRRRPISRTMAKTSGRISSSSVPSWIFCLQRVRALAESLVRPAADLGLQRVDGGDAGPHPLDVALVLRSEDLAENQIDHDGPIVLPGASRAGGEPGLAGAHFPAPG